MKLSNENHELNSEFLEEFFSANCSEKRGMNVIDDLEENLKKSEGEAMVS